MLSRNFVSAVVSSPAAVAAFRESADWRYGVQNRCAPERWGDHWQGTIGERFMASQSFSCSASEKGSPAMRLEVGKT